MGLGMLMTGVASGFGKGAQQGLQNFQNFYSAQQLQQERQAYEAKRLDRIEELAMAREGRQMTHAENLQEQGFGHAEQLQKQGFEHTEAMTGQQITSSEAMKEMDRDQAKKFHEDEKGLKDRELGMKEKQHKAEMDAKGRELSIHEQHYKDMAPWYKRAGTMAAAKGDPAVKLTVDTLMDSAKRSHESAQKYEEAAQKAVDPNQTKDLRVLAQRERQNALMSESKAFSMLGITPTVGSTGGGTKIVDPDEKKMEKPATGALSKPAPTSSVNLPRMGEKSALPKIGVQLPSGDTRLPPTLKDVATFLQEHEAATNGTGKVSDVVNKFRDRFGRLPTSDEMTAVNRRGLLQTPAR